MGGRHRRLWATPIGLQRLEVLLEVAPQAASLSLPWYRPRSFSSCMAAHSASYASVPTVAVALYCMYMTAQCKRS